MTTDKSVTESFSKTHELHMTTLQMQAVSSLEEKYKKGVKEHGGTKLWEMATNSLVNNAVDEAIDQITYLFTLRQQMRIILALAKEGSEDEELTNPKARECCHLIYTTLTGQTKIE